MANLKSSKKSIRQTERRSERNKHVRTTLKTLAKKVKAATTAGDAKKAKEISQDYISALDKAAKRGIIHFNKARRHKSSMAKHIFATVA